MSAAELLDSLQAAAIAARKAQDKGRTLVLGSVLADLKNRRIDLQRELTDADIAEALRKQIKQRQEAAEQFRAAGRDELAGREAFQQAVIEEFLPPEASADDLRAAVRAAIEGGAADIGRVMGQVMPQFRGRADGKLINQIAREELAAR